MKFTIDGQRFDTNKAERIANASYDGSRTDFQWWSETLYRTPRSKRFFLVGEGGAMTRYARRVDVNSYTGGERCDPMTDAEALAWAEDHMTADEIDAAFPGVVSEA